MFEAQYGQHERRVCGLAGSAEVSGCARLMIGSSRHYHRLARRRGKQRALVAVGNSLLTIA